MKKQKLFRSFDYKDITIGFVLDNIKFFGNNSYFKCDADKKRIDFIAELEEDE